MFYELTIFLSGVAIGFIGLHILYMVYINHSLLPKIQNVVDSAITKIDIKNIGLFQ